MVVDGSNALTQWTAAHGPNLSAVTGHPAYSTGAQANGHLGIIGPVAGARLGSTAVVKAGLHTKFTSVVVFDPDDIYGVGDRQYIGLYYWANETSSANHWVRTSLANVGGPIPFNRIGHYVGELGGSGWQSVAGVGCLRSLHMMCFTYDGTIGETVFYQNGSPVATLTTAPITGMKAEAPVVFASYETTDPPINQWYKGTAYKFLEYWDFVATPTQVADKFAEMQARYSIVVNPFLPTDISSLVGWYNEGGKLGPGGAVYNGTNLAQQDNQATTTSLLSYSGGLVDGGVTGRPNGRQYNVFDGTDDFGSNGPLGDMISASAYYRAHVVKVDSCGTNSGAGYVLDALWCDQSGYKWESFKDNAGASFDMKCGHWDGGEKNATIAAMTYGVWYLVEHGYDGTNLTAVATPLAGGSAITATPTAAGSVTGAGLVQPFRIGRSASSNYADMNVAVTISCNAYPNSTDRTNLHDYLVARYGG